MQQDSPTQRFAHRRAPGPRRTERLAIPLTPAEYEHLADVATERNVPLAHLGRQALVDAGLLPGGGR